MINIKTIRNLDRVKKCLRGTVITGGVYDACNDAGAILFVILKGKVGVYTNYMQPEAEMIRTLGAGDLFADPGLLLDKQAAYTTVSLSDLLFLPIERKTFCEFLQEEPALAFELMRELCLRLEQTNTAYKALIIQHDTQQRSRARPPVAAEIRAPAGNQK
jgi:CRP-like cAMP-binding protein